MHRGKWFIGIALICGLLAGCLQAGHSDDSSVYGTWRLAGISLKGAANSDFNTQAQLRVRLKAGELISFFQEKGYSTVSGDGIFNTGRWDFAGDKRHVTLNAHGDKNLLGTIRKADGKPKKYFYNLEIVKNNTIFRFVKEAIPMKDEKEDPFYPVNNRWRRVAASPEDSTQITEKLSNYFQHLAMILKAAKERQQDVVSFEYSMGPVKIYNGGIGILPCDQVPVTWKNTFNTDSTAREAYLRFQHYLQNNTYQGAATGDWVEDDYNILLSICAGFQSAI